MFKSQNLLNSGSLIENAELENLLQIRRISAGCANITFRLYNSLVLDRGFQWSFRLDHSFCFLVIMLQIRIRIPANNDITFITASSSFKFQVYQEKLRKYKIWCTTARSQAIAIRGEQWLDTEQNSAQLYRKPKEQTVSKLNSPRRKSYSLSFIRDTDFDF